MRNKSTRGGRVSRRHHVVPVFQLAGFTDTGLRDGVLQVIDRRTGRTWTSTPKGVGFETDYHRLPGSSDEDALERAFCDIESRAGAAIRAARGISGDLDGRELSDLLEFVAAMYLRSPRYRSGLLRETGRLTKWMFQNTFTEATWMRFVEQMKARGRGAGLDASQFAEMERFVQSGEFDVRYGPELHHETLVENVDFVHSLLMKRRWAILRFAPETGGLVCSDSPVSICWGFRPEPESAARLSPPGLVHKRSHVSVALDHDLGLLGYFGEGRPLADNRAAAVLNIRTIDYSFRQVYARDLDFRWLDMAEVVRTGPELVELFRRRAGGRPGDARS